MYIQKWQCIYMYIKKWQCTCIYTKYILLIHAHYLWNNFMLCVHTRQLISCKGVICCACITFVYFTFVYLAVCLLHGLEWNVSRMMCMYSQKRRWVKRWHTCEVTCHISLQPIVYYPLKAFTIHLNMFISLHSLYVHLTKEVWPNVINVSICRSGMDS